MCVRAGELAGDGAREWDGVCFAGRVCDAVRLAVGRLLTDTCGLCVLETVRCALPVLVTVMCGLPVFVTVRAGGDTACARH